MEFNNLWKSAWDTSRAMPVFAHQPAWARVPTKPLNKNSKLSTIMVRVSTLNERARRANSNASSSASALPSWPGAEQFLKTFQQNPRVDLDVPFKRARLAEFQPASDDALYHGPAPTEAFTKHEECKALVDVANNYLHQAEEYLFPLYRSMRDGTYLPPVTGKRRRDPEYGDYSIHKGKFQTICDVMYPVEAARRDGLTEITVQSAAIAYQSYETYPQNSRFPLVFHGIPTLTDITERSEPQSPPKIQTMLKPATVSLDARSDSDIFATAPIAQSPTPAPRDPAPVVGSPTPSDTASEPAPQSPASFPASPPFSFEDAKSEAPPAVISQLAEAAGNRLDGNANVVIKEGPNGRLFVRFKISGEYASLFPTNEALDNASMVAETPIAASTPQLTPELSSDPATPSPVVVEAPLADEPSTPTPKAMPKTDSPQTAATPVESALSELSSTPIIYEDEESPSRTYMREFIERSRRVVGDNASPIRTALAPISPNKASPVKQASPLQNSPEKASPEKASPKRQESPKKASAPAMRRSTRLTNKAPKSSIPTPIRIDSRSGAGRVKAAAPDLTNLTRHNTKKNKGKAVDPKAVLAAMAEAGPSPPPVTKVVKASKDTKTVQWKTPVEEQPPKRVTRSRAKKIAAARA